MPKLLPRRILFILSLSLVAFCSTVAVSVAQSTITSSITRVTTVYSTNTSMTTITNSTTLYTTTTQTSTATAQTVQTVTQLSTTTTTSSYTTIVSSTIAQTVSFVVTESSTQTSTLLGNSSGESLALVLLVAAVVSFAIPRLYSGRPRGLVCSQCGYRNPPFAHSFCVKCGQALKQK